MKKSYFFASVFSFLCAGLLDSSQAMDKIEQLEKSEDVVAFLAQRREPWDGTFIQSKITNALSALQAQLGIEHLGLPLFQNEVTSRGARKIIVSNQQTLSAYISSLKTQLTTRKFKEKVNRNEQITLNDVNNLENSIQDLTDLAQRAAKMKTFQNSMFSLAYNQSDGKAANSTITSDDWNNLMASIASSKEISNLKLEQTKQDLIKQLLPNDFISLIDMREWDKLKDDARNFIRNKYGINSTYEYEDSADSYNKETGYQFAGKKRNEQDKMPLLAVDKLSCEIAQKLSNAGFGVPDEFIVQTLRQLELKFRNILEGRLQGFANFLMHSALNYDSMNSNIAVITLKELGANKAGFPSEPDMNTYRANFEDEFCETLQGIGIENPMVFRKDINMYMAEELCKKNCLKIIEEIFAAVHEVVTEQLPLDAVDKTLSKYTNLYVKYIKARAESDREQKNVEFGGGGALMSKKAKETEAARAALSDFLKGSIDNGKSINDYFAEHAEKLKEKVETYVNIFYSAVIEELPKVKILDFINLNARQYFLSSDFRNIIRTSQVSYELMFMKAQPFEISDNECDNNKYSEVLKVALGEDLVDKINVASLHTLYQNRFLAMKIVTNYRKDMSTDEVDEILLQPEKRSQVVGMLKQGQYDPSLRKRWLALKDSNFFNDDACKKEKIKYVFRFGDEEYKKFISGKDKILVDENSDLTAGIDHIIKEKKEKESIQKQKEESKAKPGVPPAPPPPPA